MGQWYDTDGKGKVWPVSTFNTPARGKRSHWVVEETEIGGYEVSTVFLGLDHASLERTPVLWETMVFGLPADCEIQVRYTSDADARTGHSAMVERLTAQVAAIAAAAENLKCAQEALESIVESVGWPNG